MESVEGSEPTRLIDTLLEDTRCLLATLEAEQAALQAGDGNALQAAITRKQAQLSGLAAHLAEVTAFEQLAEDPGRLEELREALRHLRDNNLNNGYQILLHRQFAEDAIAALRGRDPGADVYGENARRPSVPHSRPVAKV